MAWLADIVDEWKKLNGPGKVAAIGLLAGVAFIALAATRRNTGAGTASSATPTSTSPTDTSGGGAFTITSTTPPPSVTPPPVHHIPGGGDPYGPPTRVKTNQPPLRIHPPMGRIHPIVPVGRTHPIGPARPIGTFARTFTHTPTTATHPIETTRGGPFIPWHGRIAE